MAKQWEYNAHSFPWTEKDEKLEGKKREQFAENGFLKCMNEIGEQGWEAIGFHFLGRELYVLFKREKQ